jgi:hypothetical protein
MYFNNDPVKIDHKVQNVTQCTVQGNQLSLDAICKAVDTGYMQ